MPDIPTRPSLFHHPNFLKLWVGDTISQFGTQVSQLAIPLIAIIFLRVSPFEVALLDAHTMSPLQTIRLLDRGFRVSCLSVARPCQRL